MNTKEIMALIECYHTAETNEWHHAYKEELERVVDELIHENHNLNWALNNDGYAELYTEDERSDSAEAAKYIEAFSIKLKQAKEQYNAMVTDAARYRVVLGMSSRELLELYCARDGERESYIDKVMEAK
jgi:hypothetical protein